MTMRVLVLAVAVAACGCRSTAPDIQRVAGANYRGTIFSSEHVRRTWYGPVKQPPPLWTPTPSDVARFERRFTAYLERLHQPLGHGDDPSLAMRQRIRQYSGVFDYDSGRRVLRVGLYCEDYGERFVGVMDDGYECDCRALYDPATRKVLAFGCAMHGPPYAYPRDPSLPPAPQLPMRAEPESPAVDPANFH